MRFRRWLLLPVLLCLVFAGLHRSNSDVFAQETDVAAMSEESVNPPAADPSVEDEEDGEASQSAVLAFALDNITLFICAVLVLFMQAGFGMLEAGLNTAKHTVNILCKNLMDLSVGVILFFL